METLLASLMKTVNLTHTYNSNMIFPMDFSAFPCEGFGEGNIVVFQGL